MTVPSGAVPSAIAARLWTTHQVRSSIELATSEVTPCSRTCAADCATARLRPVDNRPHLVSDGYGAAMHSQESGGSECPTL